MNRLDETAGALGVELQPFERGRASLLAAAMAVAPGIHAVLELFDKQGGAGFTPEDSRLAAAAADFGAEVLRQALAERQTHAVLFDAVEAALDASAHMASSLGAPPARPDEPPPAAVLDQLREGLSSSAAAPADAAETLRLAEAVRVLALRHGPTAVRHCTRLVESMRELLDTATGS